jgi:FAD dependent oxidoreductase
MNAPTLDIDIAIIGGGIAGLWSLNQLRNSGYQAVLFEQEALGSYQTIGSQGMIHGGIKYALGGALSGGSEAIASMPDTWRKCLQGQGKVDLRGCRVLSEDFFLWSNASLQSRLTSFFASKMLRGRVEKLSEQDYPTPFCDPDFRGQVYRLVDLVLDMPSLVETLASRHSEAIYKIDWQQSRLTVDHQRQAHLELPGIKVKPRRLLLTAGTGNEELIAQLGGQNPAMQRRPLQQVLVKHQYREKLYAHCMDGNPSPRLTISTHRTANDEPVWYLGGDLATEGTQMDSEALIQLARTELSDLLPWVDFGECEWRTLKLDRAEPRQSSLLRPDEAFVGKVDSTYNTLAAWPTKLTLTPNLADSIEHLLHKDRVRPGPLADLSVLEPLGRPSVAPTTWDTLFQ